MAKDQSMMPFLSAYWPQILVGLFVYVLTYLIFDRSKARKISTVEPYRVEPKKRQENCDNDDDEAGDSEEVKFFTALFYQL